MLGSEAAVSREVNACLDVLKLAYGCDVWQDYTTQVKRGTMHLSGTAPIMLAAQKFIDEHSMGDEHGCARRYMQSCTVPSLYSQCGQHSVAQ